MSAEALNPDNLMCRAIKAIKDAVGSDIGVLTDVALDPYTSHGQDGLLIPQLSDYTVEATRGLLVDAAYTVYEETHIEPLRVRSVEPLSSQSVRVNLLQWTDKADKSRFTLKDVYGNTRNIQQASLSQDGKIGRAHV